MPTVAPYGSWKSHITSDVAMTQSISLGSIAISGDDVYWVENRPEEGGRNVIVHCSPDRARNGNFNEWYDEPGVAIGCCADGLRPVVFTLERK